MSVVDINSRRPHQSGPAKCLHCLHEWTAVSPVGENVLDCPKCELSKGIYSAIYAPAAGDVLFRCECGREHFYVIPTGVLCANCGTITNFSEL